MSVPILQNTLQYKGNLPWLLPRTLFLTKAGSHAYGTSTPTSDVDYRGVSLPPLEYDLGLLHTFEQAEGPWGLDAKGDPIDCVLMSFRKFLGLAMECNPNVIELLFTDPMDHVVCHPWFQKVIDNRHAFLSVNAQHRFCGYALGQLKKMQTHRGWVLHPPKRPTREDFGLPETSVIAPEQRDSAEQVIRMQLDSWEFDWEVVDMGTRIALKDYFEKTLTEIKINADQKVDAAARAVGFSDDFLDVLRRERGFRSAMNNFHNYEKWLKERSGTRFQTQEKFGFDTKNAMHLVRLLRMGLEIISTGEVVVKRPDAQELLAIRNGTWTYEQLMGWAEAKMEEIRVAARTTSLPKSPNKAVINALCIEITQKGHVSDSVW